MTNSWYVLTGGPSCGKTTLVGEFERLGYHTVPEAARLVIDEGIAEGRTIEEIREDELDFQNTIMRRKIAIETSLEPRNITFLDRGMHDTEAYMNLHNFDMEEWVVTAIRAAQYRKIFWLEPLADYEQDYARTESAEQIATLNGLLFRTYADAGMEPIRVPAASVPNRVQLILGHVYEVGAKAT